jgi:hypothetical protein
MSYPTELRSRPVRRFGQAFAASVSSASLLLGGCAAAPSPLSEAEKAALFEPACRGESVAGAADYPGGGTPHRIVIIDLDRQAAPYFPYLSGEWQSQSVADAQLVGCMKIERSVVGSCQYIGHPSVERRLYTISMEVRTAGTGERIHADEFSASPPSCPSTIGSQVFGLGGPPYDKLEAWLAPIVTGSAQP